MWKHCMICQQTNAKQIWKVAWYGKKCIGSSQTELGFLSPLHPSSVILNHNSHSNKHLFSASRMPGDVLSIWHALSYLIFIRV